MGADETRNALLNVGGTQNAIDLANALEVGTLPPHVLDRGRRRLYDEGTFNEDMFDEGQKLAHPYHRTKFESEKLVRERVKARGASTAHRSSSATAAPARWTRSTGPYYFFKLIQKVRHDAAGVVPADLARVGLDQHRPGRLRRRRPSTTSPTRTGSTARPSTSSTRRASASARC